MEYRMKAPLSPGDMRVLRAGDVVYLTGTIYTARDAAHARFDQMLLHGEVLPVPKGCCIYYTMICFYKFNSKVSKCDNLTKFNHFSSCISKQIVFFQFIFYQSHCQSGRIKRHTQFF